MKFTTAEAIDIVKVLDTFGDKNIEMNANFQWDFIDNYDELKKIADKYEKLMKDTLSPGMQDGRFVQDENGMITATEGNEEEFRKCATKLNEFLLQENEVEVKKISRDDTPKGLSLNDLKAIKFMFD